VNSGERIINEIIKQGMVRVAEPRIAPDQTVIFAWSATSVDQLDALVETIVRERTARLRREVVKWQADSRLLGGALVLLQEAGIPPSSTELIAAADRATGGAK
jgi:hypothetical protein